MSQIRDTTILFNVSSILLHHFTILSPYQAHFQAPHYPHILYSEGSQDRFFTFYYFSQLFFQSSVFYCKSFILTFS